ncbi:Ger(x)C family spore germination protein [Lysinibacillus sp. 54212]|uniref:Ger(x)C family spore germination protein n=1 Tax=Lysinibacillus sp. 54212 TaxID=3119829 RepID=UPI002FCAC9A3
MKKWWAIILSAVLLAGCWDFTEPERMYYVYGVGVDFEDDQYKIYVQLIDFTNVAKSEQPNPNVVQAEVGTASGHTIAEAFFNLYHSLDMRLFWGHLAFVVMSESTLEDGRANLVVDSFSRYRETRYQVWVYGTKENLEEFMLITPVLNKSITLSKLTEPLNSFDQESFIVPVDFRKFIIGLNEPSYSIPIPYVEISNNWASEKKKQQTVHFNEIAIIESDGLKEVFKEEEITGLRFMKEETQRGEITYDIEGAPVTITVENIKVDVKAKVKNERFLFDIKVGLTAIASDFHKEITKKQIRDTVIEEVEKKIKETYLAGLKKDVDIYNLSNYAYKQNVKHWKKVEEQGRIPLDEDSIASIEIYIEKLSAARKEFTETIKEKD